MKTRVIAIVAAVVAAAVAYWLLAGPKPAPAPAAPQAKAELKTTGIYADDWQADCAPLAGPAQAACTAALDAHYGKTDSAPVPAPTGGGY
jgi:hypothetical protein